MIRSCAFKLHMQVVRQHLQLQDSFIHISFTRRIRKSNLTYEWGLETLLVVKVNQLSDMALTTLYHIQFFLRLTKDFAIVYTALNG